MIDLRNVDLRLLAVFEAIYESGTISGAAERLALGQSAASEALARLREECGDDLFVAVDDGLSPTPPAEAMYSVLAKALHELRTTLQESVEASKSSPNEARCSARA